MVVTEGGLSPTKAHASHMRHSFLNPCIQHPGQEVPSQTSDDRDEDQGDFDAMYSLSNYIQMTLISGFMEPLNSHKPDPNNQ